MKLTPRPAAGFSLIEVICALLILAVGLTGLTQGITTALRSSQEVEGQTLAVALAEGRMEWVRADGFLVAGEESSEDGEDSQYGWQQTIVETSTEGLFEVTIAVRHLRTDRTVYELKTLLFDIPLETAGLPGETDSGEAGRKRRRN